MINLYTAFPYNNTYNLSIKQRSNSNKRTIFNYNETSVFKQRMETKLSHQLSTVPVYMLQIKFVSSNKYMRMNIMMNVYNNIQFIFTGVRSNYMQL